MQINVVLHEFVHSQILTIAISAGNRPELLARLLASLRVQHTPWGSVETLIGSPSPQENLSQVRNRLFAQASGRWVYFVDEDCELPDPHFLSRLVEHAEANGGAVGGFYLGGDGAWQRAYNALANFWLVLHHAQGQGLPVAGNFALARGCGVPPNFPFGKVAFAGEEVHLKRRLDTLGIRFHLLPELSVRHNGKKGLVGFFKRAWHHGKGPRQKVKRRRAAVSFARHAARTKSLATPVLMASYMAVVLAARTLPGREKSTL